MRAAALDRSMRYQVRTPATECRAVSRPTGKRSARHAARLDRHKSEKTLSVVYLVALIGVSVALLGALADTVWSLSRKPAWRAPRHGLSAVVTLERRAQALPFVGADRRTEAKDSHSEVDRLAA